jgi:hypothetical protein
MVRPNKLGTPNTIEIVTVVFFYSSCSIFKVRIANGMVVFFTCGLKAKSCITSHSINSKLHHVRSHIM